MKRYMSQQQLRRASISVLSVEPYGMKPRMRSAFPILATHFSALGRAVWDETRRIASQRQRHLMISVLSVEPYGMKLHPEYLFTDNPQLSVLSVEPYGMKLLTATFDSNGIPTFSALGRAVWDETGPT